MSGCGAYSLVGTDGQQAGVYPLRCKSWRCGRCGPRKKRATIARIRRGLRLGQTRLLTVTSPAGEDRDTSYAELQERWRRLLRLLERRFGNIEYVAVVEPQRRGAAHLHVVFRGPFIAQPWLSLAAKAAGFGPIADVRLVRGDVATYVTKALTAELTDESAAPPPFFRRVRWSRHWGTCPPRPRRIWPNWHIVIAPPGIAALSAMARGYEIVEVVGPSPPSGPMVDRAIAWCRDLRSYLLGRARAAVALSGNPA